MSIERNRPIQRETNDEPAGDLAQRRGRVLKVKQGYNPNSSSMGSIIYAFPTAMLGVTALFGMVVGAVASALIRVRDGRAADDRSGAVADAVADESADDVNPPHGDGV